MAPSPTQCFTIAKILRSLAALREDRIVSRPQILSRLRYVNIVTRPDETEEEKAYRAHYENLQDWNNRYWTENNELFNKSKSDYIKANFGNIAEDEALSHDQLATFYRGFLEENRAKHVDYNKKWYKSHISLLQSAMMAKFSRLKLDLGKLREIKNVSNS